MFNKLYYENIIKSSPLFSFSANNIDNTVYPVLPYEGTSFYHIVEPIILRNITFDDEITNFIKYANSYMPNKINREEILDDTLHNHHFFKSDYFNDIIDKLRIWLDNKFKETGQQFYAYIAYYIFYACVTPKNDKKWEYFITPKRDYDYIVNVFKYFYENDNRNEFRKAFDPNYDDLTNIKNIASIAYDLMQHYNMSQCATSARKYGLYSIPFYMQDLYKYVNYYKYYFFVKNDVELPIINPL